MRIKAYKLTVLALVLITAVVSPKVCTASTKSSEYQVKAAFLYNFIKFVDWPQKKAANNNESFTIGIIGKDPFGEAFTPIKGKKIKNRNVIVKQFDTFEELKKSSKGDKSKLNEKIQAIKKCHLLFICTSEKKNLKEIINLVKEDGVLTVGEMPNFIESGGITNFLLEDKKVRFEINVTAAKRAGLKIRSQLLRMAKRLIDNNDLSKNIKNIKKQYALYTKLDNKT